MIMCDGATAPNPAQCASAASNAVGNDDGIIDAGEKPEIQTNLWIDVDWTDASDQSFFDLASSYWTTGPAGPDQTGDGWEDPLSGLAANSANLATNSARLGATIGEITFKISTNLTGALLFGNNVDDTISDQDPTVMGQPPVCNSSGNDPDRLPLQDTFELWTATTCLSTTVDHRDTTGSGCNDSQEDSTGGGPDADVCTLDGGPPEGVVKSPAPLMRILLGSGLPLSQYMTRSFGIPRLDILGVASNDVDVNFLIFNMVQEQGRYYQVTVVQYPGEPGIAPEAGSNDDALAQSVVTCSPYWTSPVRVFGVAVTPDYDGDTVVDTYEGNVEVGWTNRVAMDEAGPFDYVLTKSMDEDYDGDGIANPYDRCRIDASCGLAAHDTDGDFLCGLCETTGAGNGEGTGCTVGQPLTTVPWHVCQDVDEDGYLNQNDNCPTVANGIGDPKPQLDSDADTVGDACDAAPDIPGDGNGYVGGFNDADNICVDQFTIGLGEPASEAGAPPSTVIGSEGKYCMGPATEVGATQEPYVNPAMHAIGVSPFRDASDDGEPDYEVVAGVGTLYDANSDEDLDGHSDGCEGFSGTDALDPSSMPVAPAVAGIPGVGGDCDGGGEWDYAEDAKAFPTDPFNAGDDASPPLMDLVDTDGDGCVDSEEIAGAAAPKPGATGNYNPFDPSDFYDVPIPAVPDPNPNGTLNQAVAMDDVLGVLFYVGTYAGDAGIPNANGVAYDVDKDGNTRKDGRDYDRAPSPAPNPPWNAGAPSGAVAMDDVLAVLAQTGLSCIDAPNPQPVDLVVQNLVLTLNGVPQTPLSTVKVNPSDIVDVQLEENVLGQPLGHPVQVLERVHITRPPNGTYHCVNEDLAVVKDPDPLQKKWQSCTLNGFNVPVSFTVNSPLFGTIRLPLGVAVEWELEKAETYIKTVNLFHNGPDDVVVWEVAAGMGAGLYPILVCVDEQPMPPAVETNQSNNRACTAYVLDVDP